MLNDFGDVSHDRAAGKPNAFLSLPKSNRTAIGIAFLVMAVGPWIWFPVDEISLALLLGELLLFALYALKPFRLKERGWIGVFTDALYAHVIPSTLATYTFILIAGIHVNNFISYIGWLAAWQFFLGCRNILYHQIKDVSNDESVGIKTAVTTIGVKTSRTIIRRVLLPSEIACLFGFAWVITPQVSWFIPLLLVHWVLIFIKHKRLPFQNLKSMTDLYLDGFYIKWYPVLVLIAIVMAPIEVTPIIAAHLVLFPNDLTSWLIPKVSSTSTRIGQIVHWIFGGEKYLSSLGRNLLFFFFYLVIFIISYYILRHWFGADSFHYIQMQLSRTLVIAMLTHLGILVWQRRTLVIATITTYFLEPGSAYNLAIVRILFMGMLAGEIEWIGRSSFANWAKLPVESREPLPFIGWFIEWVPISPEIYEYAVLGALITAILSLFGIATRLSLLSFLPFAFYVWAVPCFFGKLNHNQIVLWVPFFLALGPSGKVLSVDYFINRFLKRNNKITPSVRYGLPLKFIWLQLAIIYCFSGIHKLWDTGLSWALSESVINQIHHEWFEHFDKIPAIRVDEFPSLTKLGGMLVILGECLFPVLLFHPNLRPLAFIGDQVFHRITDYFLYIYFHHLVTLTYSWINWHNLILVLKNKIGIGSMHNEGHNRVRQRFIPLKWKLVASIRIPLLAGGLLICVNGLFSIFSINSWPFSAYPTYSAYYKSTVDMLQLKLWDSTNQQINYLKLVQEANLRWENLRPFETQIIDDYHKGNTLETEADVLNYFRIWQNNVDGLSDIHRLRANIVTVPLNPDSRSDTVSIIHLIDININKQDSK